jgi:tetratricopeptide (TPR) repeat protein
VPALRAKAEILARQNDTEALEETLTKIEQASPETGLGEFGKGRLYKAQKKFPEAIAAFEQALAKDPGSILVLTELVNTEIANGDTDKAIKRLTGILESDPEHRAAHFLLGGAYMANKDYASAESEFVKQLAVHSENVPIYKYIAAARFQQQDIAGAEAALRQGLDALPDDKQLLIDLIDLYQSQQMQDKAIEVMQRGIKAHPAEQRFPLALAGISERNKEYERAIEIYEAHLIDNPGSLVVTNNLAVLLSEHRSDAASLSRAVTLAEKLADAEQPALRDTLGWAYYKQGDYTRAAEVLSAVVEQAPDVPVFRYHLGMAYYKQGDMRAAREILAGAVADDYKYDGVDEARAVYDEISKE